MEKLIKKCMNLCQEEEFIFGEGSRKAKIMLIGEAPGENEIKKKRPFVGKAGKNLDELLSILEINRAEIYITNSVKIRPYKISEKTGRKINRSPNKEEINKFREIIIGEIEYVQPKIIVTLGNIPLNQITEKNIKIGDCHGKLMKINISEKEYKIFPLYHPASIIYNRKLKDVYIEDIIILKEIIKKY